MLNWKNENLFKSRWQISNEKLVADMGLGKLSAIQIQTAVFQRSGNILSLSNINSITVYYSKGIRNDHNFDGVFEGRGS